MPKFVLSSQHINNYGLVILTAGIILDRFRDNPIMLDGHKNENASVLGTWEGLEVDSEDRLLGDPVFDDPEQDANVKLIKGKVDRGVIKAASIGIDIISLERIPGFDVPVVTKCELLEVSICPVPSNANALRLYKDGKLLTPEKLTAMLSALPTDEDTPNLNNTMTPEQKKIRLDLGLPEDATDAQVSAKIGELTALKNQNADNAAQALVDGAFSAGKITEAEKPSMLKLAVADYGSTKALIDARVTTSPAKEDEPEEENKGQKKLSATERMAGAKNKTKVGEHNDDGTNDDRSGWTHLKWSQEDPEGLLDLKANKPDEYKKLLLGIRNKHGKSLDLKA